MMKLYRKYLALQVKSAFEYRASLIFDMISGSLTTIASFFAIFLLFKNYETIGGYSFSEVLITYALVNFTFSVAECMFRGFDTFDKLVRTGELDRLLIRPRSVFLQVLGHKIELNKIGRILFSGAVLVWACVNLSITWTAMKLMVILLMVFGSIIIFAGMFLLFSSMCIFTVEGIEVVNVITNGGRDLAQYPIDVYSGFFRKVFTYIIPLGVVNYLPLQYLLGFSNATIWHALSPLFSIVFFAICFFIFKWSLTKYKSTGS